MDRKPIEPKQMGTEKTKKNDSLIAENDDEGGGEVDEEQEKKRRSSSNPLMSTAAIRRGGGGGGGGGVTCQAEKCTADLTEAKRYHRRHKVCESHSKAPVVLVAGLRQRFCQQCSRFHELSEFDDAKRSCRRRLAGHNERRRKSSSESQGEGSSQCRQADQGSGGSGSGTMQLNLPGSSAYKNFQIR